jgi:hypothetical protein
MSSKQHKEFLVMIMTHAIILCPLDTTTISTTMATTMSTTTAITKANSQGQCFQTHRLTKLTKLLIAMPWIMISIAEITTLRK